MALHCDICGKRFKRLEDVFTHPYSYVKPKLVHRHCLPPNVAVFGGYAALLPITTSLEMAIPSVLLLMIILWFLLMLSPTTFLFFVYLIIALGILYMRIRFLSYYFKAAKEFEE